MCMSSFLTWGNLIFFLIIILYEGNIDFFNNDNVLILVDGHLLTYTRMLKHLLAERWFYGWSTL